MKKHKWFKALKTSLSLSVIVTLLLGCSNTAKEVAQIEPMEAETSNAISFDFIGGKDVMPIAGYWGPYLVKNGEDGQSPPDYNSEEYWKIIADCGINLMSYSDISYSKYPQAVIKSLEYGEKYGISVVVNDQSIIDLGEKEEIALDEVTEKISNYMNYPAFAGVYLVDEPWTPYYAPSPNKQRELAYLKNIAGILNKEIGVFTYSNAHPSGVDNHLYEHYEKYIREFCDVLQPKYLMFDRYPFDSIQEGYMDRYFYDLSIVRMVAQENNIPFWTFIQAGSQWNDEGTYFDSDGYYPSEGEFDWNVNVVLAFGAQGINYFPLIQPYHFAYAESTPFDFERNGLIGVWGNKNRWYYYAQEMTKQIEAVDEILMNSVNKGVLACGEQANKDMSLAKNYNVLLEGTSWRELKDVEGDAMIGCFNYQGKTALYVVNYSTEYAQKINLIFQDTYNMTVIQNAEIKELQGKNMTLDMLPGEGALIVFE